MNHASFANEVLPELRAQATIPAPEQRLVRYALICAWLTARCEKAGRQDRYARAMEGCLWATPSAAWTAPARGGLLMMSHSTPAAPHSVSCRSRCSRANNDTTPERLHSRPRSCTSGDGAFPKEQDHDGFHVSELPPAERSPAPECLHHAG